MSHNYIYPSKYNENRRGKSPNVQPPSQFNPSPQQFTPGGHPFNPSSQQFSQPLHHNNSSYNSPQQSGPQPPLGPPPINQKPSSNYAEPIDYNSLFVPIENPEMNEEFDFYQLGIDLHTKEPLLPNLYYLGSDMPMINYGQFPVPKIYPTTVDSNQINQISKFSVETLLFIFYLHTQDELQVAAYNELKQRGLIYEKEKQVWWSNSNKYVFNTDTWKFVKPDDMKKAPILH